MKQKIAQLLMYGALDRNSILFQMGELLGQFESGYYENTELLREINTQVRKLLQVATDYGFDHNLWQNYLTFFLMMDENPFSITCEKTGAGDGSVNEIVEQDFRIFMELFHYDFSLVEEAFDIKCFTRISNYRAIQKKELMYNKNVSERVQALSSLLAGAKDEREFFEHVTGFYKDYGVGMFGLNKAFRIDDRLTGAPARASAGMAEMQEGFAGGFSGVGASVGTGGTGAGRICFRPINNMDTVMLDDLVGYELQKQKLIENTEAFVHGRSANNVLLYGDSGTGKSTSIKAIVNQYYKDGLRMIEIYKHQFKDLSAVIAEIKNRNYRFIIYMDDLSFEEHEIEYKFLKAVIEGGVETKPENILIYATSNRRHLIRETWNDRNDQDNSDDRHHSDTVEEKLSLVHRFGVTINFSKPTQKEFFEIVIHLARKAGIAMPDQELCAWANRWELSHGGISGRTAQQFVNYLLSIGEEKERLKNSGKKTRCKNCMDGE